VDHTDVVPVTSRPAVVPGTEVEVHSAFSGRWVQGFEVAECADEGYRLRRRSDDTLLPTVFDRTEVRSRS